MREMRKTQICLMIAVMTVLALFCVGCNRSKDAENQQRPFYTVVDAIDDGIFNEQWLRDNRVVWQHAYGNEGIAAQLRYQRETKDDVYTVLHMMYSLLRVKSDFFESQTINVSDSYLNWLVEKGEASAEKRIDGGATYYTFTDSAENASYTVFWYSSLKMMKIAVNDEGDLCYISNGMHPLADTLSSYRTDKKTGDFIGLMAEIVKYDPYVFTRVGESDKINISDTTLSWLVEQIKENAITSTVSGERIYENYGYFFKYDEASKFLQISVDGGKEYIPLTLAR